MTDEIPSNCANIALKYAGTTGNTLSDCYISYIMEEKNGRFYLIFIHPDNKKNHTGLSIEVHVEERVIPGFLYGSTTYHDLRLRFVPIDWKNVKGAMKFTIRNLGMDANEMIHFKLKSPGFTFPESTILTFGFREYTILGVNDRELDLKEMLSKIGGEILRDYQPLSK
jgi:hypothetical protein